MLKKYNLDSVPANGRTQSTLPPHSISYASLMSGYLVKARVAVFQLMIFKNHRIRNSDMITVPFFVKSIIIFCHPSDPTVGYSA